MKLNFENLACTVYIEPRDFRFFQKFPLTFVNYITNNYGGLRNELLKICQFSESTFAKSVLQNVIPRGQKEVCEMPTNLTTVCLLRNCILNI